MLQGKVLPTGEPTIRVTIRGQAGTIANVEALVDTGFNDEVALPPWVIEKLALKFIDASTYMLADGLKYSARVFGAEIQWRDTWRPIMVVEVEHDPLLGMGIMIGCHLAVDAVPGGSVTIVRLESERHSQAN